MPLLMDSNGTLLDYWIKSKFFSPTFTSFLKKALLYSSSFFPTTCYCKHRLQTRQRPYDPQPLFSVSLNFFSILFPLSPQPSLPKQSLLGEHPSFMKPSLVIGSLLTIFDLFPRPLNWALKLSISNFSWKDYWGGTWNANYLYAVTII